MIVSFFVAACLWHLMVIWSVCLSIWWSVGVIMLGSSVTYCCFHIFEVLSSPVNMFWLSFVVLDHDLNCVATSKSSSSTIPDSRFCYCLCGQGEGCLQCDVMLARPAGTRTLPAGGGALICLLGWNWNQNMHGYYGYEAWVSFMEVLCDPFNSMVIWCQDQDVIDSKSLTSITSVSIMYACGSVWFDQFWLLSVVDCVWFNFSPYSEQQWRLLSCFYSSTLLPFCLFLIRGI